MELCKKFYTPGQPDPEPGVLRAGITDAGVGVDARVPWSVARSMHSIIPNIE
jgi:hypothetical protein